MTKENTDWMRDKGEDWKYADVLQRAMPLAADMFRQAMHDRDRFQRDAEWWEEECRKRKPTQQDAWETQP